MYKGCMLAQTWEDGCLNFPVLAEPKFDGARLLVISDQQGQVACYSKRALEKPQHARALASFKHTPGWVFDGEWYAGSWNATMSAYAGQSYDLATIEDAKFHVFDCLPLEAYQKGMWAKTNLERKQLLAQIVNLLQDTRIVYVPHQLLNSEAEVEQYFQAQLAASYEGCMLKAPTAHYQLKRISGWRKRKQLKELTATIIRLDEGEGKHQGKLGSIRAALDGQEVGIGTGFDDDERELLWRHRASLIGQSVTFQCQHDAQQVSLVRFPRIDPGWLDEIVKKLNLLL